MKVKTITREEAQEEGAKRFKGKNFSTVKMHIFAWGAMWAQEMLFTSLKDKKDEI